MKDRNSYIGLFLIGLILFIWMYASGPSKKEIAKEQARRDSIAQVEKQAALLANQHKTAQAQPKQAITGPVSDSARKADSIANITKTQSAFGIFFPALHGTDQNITAENDLLKLTFSTRGGKISSVELKGFKTSAGGPLILFYPDSSRFGLILNAYAKFISTDTLYFSPASFKSWPSTSATSIVSTNASNPNADSVSLTMQLNTSDPNKYIQFIYTLKKGSYLVSCKVKTVGMQDVIASNAGDMTLDWAMHTPSQEANLQNQRRASTVYFKYSSDEIDYLSVAKDEKKQLASTVNWVSFKQQFFSTILIADTRFASPEVSSTMSKDLTHVKSYSALLSIPYQHQAIETFGLKFFFGPNNYKLLKNYSEDNGMMLERQINLGWGIFGYVNRWIVIPVFSFLSQFNMNYGLVILILTIIIKALLFPIAFKTYVSSAKMRVLKPEIDEINKKFPKTEDAMKKQQSVMALYKKAGVNPMAGCLPLLLQLPILYALFSFFPASIELRQQHFLWANDLSTFDNAITFKNFTIPFLGDHLSIFALLMTLSQYLYLTANQQLMGNPSADQMGKTMKWMMYIMPVMFLGVLNNYSAGLSYYYFLANLITFGQTFLARRFINEDALHRKIQENKAKPVKQSKFQQRLEQLAKEQQARAKKR